MKTLFNPEEFNSIVAMLKKMATDADRNALDPVICFDTSKRIFISEDAITLEEGIHSLLGFDSLEWEKVKTQKNFFEAIHKFFSECDEIERNIHKVFDDNVTEENRVQLEILRHEELEKVSTQKERWIFNEDEKFIRAMCASLVHKTKAVLEKIRRASHIDKELLLSEWQGFETLILPQKFLAWAHDEGILADELSDILQNVPNSAQPVAQEKGTKRPRKKITVATAAKMYDVSEQTIYDWEKGKGAYQGYPGRNDEHLLKLHAQDYRNQKTMNSLGKGIKKPRTGYNDKINNMSREDAEL